MSIRDRDTHASKSSKLLRHSQRFGVKRQRAYWLRWEKVRKIALAIKHREEE